VLRSLLDPTQRLVFDIFSVISSLGVLGCFVVGLMIRNALSEIRINQEKDKGEMRLDFQNKHSENQRGLAVHVAEDSKQFEGIGRTLNRMEGKIDTLTTTVQDIS
jgi:hypothetical protein